MQFPTQNWKRNPRPWYPSFWETAVVDPLRSLCRRCFKLKTMGDWSWCCCSQCHSEHTAAGWKRMLRATPETWDLIECFAKPRVHNDPFYLVASHFKRKLDRRARLVSAWSMNHLNGLAPAFPGGPNLTSTTQVRSYFKPDWWGNKSEKKRPELVDAGQEL